MNKNIWIVIGTVVVIIGGIYFSLNSKRDEVMVTDKNIEETPMIENQVADDINMMGKIDTTMKAGSYEVYTPEKVSLASTAHSVVLFFRAGWCPTCKAVDADIRAKLGKIPTNLTILDVDYDNSFDLKKKYGVTYQHTFVQVDKDGNLIKKWSGSPTLSALVAEVK